jgi:hypothetical protein
MNTTTQLTFVSTQSIAQFKALQLTDKIDIVKNPKTGKLFLSWNGGTGAVAAKYNSGKPKIISLMQDAEGVQFFMLHNEQTSNVVESL